MRVCVGSCVRDAHTRGNIRPGRIIDERREVIGCSPRRLGRVLVHRLPSVEASKPTAQWSGRVAARAERSLSQPRFDASSSQHVPWLHGRHRPSSEPRWMGPGPGREDKLPLEPTRTRNLPDRHCHRDSEALRALASASGLGPSPGRPDVSLRRATLLGGFKPEVTIAAA